MNDKELQDWQELILHDELNKLDTMTNGMTWDGFDEMENSLFGGGRHYLGVSQRNWLKKLLIFPTPYLKERTILLDLIGEVLQRDWYTDKERVLLNSIRKNWNK